MSIIIHYKGIKQVMFPLLSNYLLFFFFLISKKDVYSKNYSMQKMHKAKQRVQKREKQKYKET